MRCVAKVVTRGRPAANASACLSNADARFASAFERAGVCPGSLDTCGAVLDACTSTVRVALPDDGPSACEAAKLDAAGRQARAELACYRTATARSAPVSAACLARAQRALTRAVARADRTGTCDGVASDIAARVDAACATAAATFASGAIADVCNSPVTSSSTSTSTSTTTTLPLAASPQRVSLGGCASSGYVAQVAIGTQTFDLVADSGSTTLAVASTACAASECRSLSPLYDPGSTATSVGTTASAVYADGSSWSGRVFTDLVSAAGATGTVRMALATIDSEHGVLVPQACSFVSVPDAYQGIFGLAGESVAVPGTDSYFDRLLATGNPLGDAFAVELCDSGGRMWLGGYDPTVALAPPSYTPAIPGNPYYAVTLADVRVGGTSLGFGAASFGPTLVDTGTTAFVLPPAAYSALADAVASRPLFAQSFAGGASWFGGGFCDIPAQAATKAELDAGLPALTLAFPSSTGTTFTVDLPATESYLLQQDDPSGNAYYCPGIEATSGSDAPTVIGASALHTLLTLFDREHARIGFAPAQGCAPLSELARSPLAAPAPASRPAPPYRRHVADAPPATAPHGLEGRG